MDSVIPLDLNINELSTKYNNHAKRHDYLQNCNQKELNGKDKYISIDNGTDVQNTEIMKESGTSFGVTLIPLLCKQLNATIEFREAKDSEHGFLLSIESNFSQI